MAHAGAGKLSVKPAQAPKGKPMPTGAFGECMSIMLDGQFRIGFISFIKRGKLLEVLDGEIEAPVIQSGEDPAKRAARLAAKKEAVPNAAKRRIVASAARETEEPDVEPADEEAQADTEAQKRIRTKQTLAVKRLLGDQANVSFGAAGVRISDGDQAFEGSTWGRAFEAACREAEVWSEALLLLASERRSQAFIPTKNLSPDGQALLQASPHVERLDIPFQAEPGGETFVVPAFVTAE